MGDHRQKTIAVDFDGVIHSYEFGWRDGSIYGYVLSGAKEAIAKLREDGFRVVVLSTRDIDQIAEWLDLVEIEVDEITHTKPPAIAYIDDRAIRFTNWPDVLKYFA